MAWTIDEDDEELGTGKKRRSPWGSMVRGEDTSGQRPATGAVTAEDEVRSRAAQMSAALLGKTGTTGAGGTTPAEEIARQRQEQLNGRPAAPAAPPPDELMLRNSPAATLARQNEPFEQARAEHRELVTRTPTQPASPLAAARAGTAPTGAAATPAAQVMTSLLTGQEAKPAGQSQGPQAQSQPGPEEGQPQFDVQGTVASTYSRVRQMIGSSVDNRVLAAAMNDKMVASIDALEDQVMALFAQYNQALDPATQAALQELRDQATQMQKDLLEDLNARGMAQSGILLEMQARLNKNQLTASQQLLAGRLSEVQDRMLSAVMDFAKMKLQTSQTFALAGLQAAESAADRAQQGNLAALQGGLTLTQMGLSSNQFNRQFTESQRQYNQGQQNWQQQFQEGMRQFGLGYDFRVNEANRNYELRKEQMTREEQANYNDDMASIVGTLSKGGSLDDILPQIEASATSPAYKDQLKSFATNYYERTPQGWLDNHAGAYRSKDELLNYLEGTGANTVVKLMGLGSYQQLLTLAQSVPEGYYPSEGTGWWQPANWQKQYWTPPYGI